MEIQNLDQFDSKNFKKYLGLYIQRRRKELNFSIEDLSKRTQINEKRLRSIELGAKKTSASEMEALGAFLQLDPCEIVKIGRITQVQFIHDYLKAVHELKS